MSLKEDVLAHLRNNAGAEVTLGELSEEFGMTRLQAAGAANSLVHDARVPVHRVFSGVYRYGDAGAGAAANGASAGGSVTLDSLGKRLTVDVLHKESSVALVKGSDGKLYELHPFQLG